MTSEVLRDCSYGWDDSFLRILLQNCVDSFLKQYSIGDDCYDFDLFQYAASPSERFSVFVAFVQPDYLNPVKNLETLLIEELLNFISDHGVDDVVDDINVNFVKWNNGEYDFFVKE